MSSTLIRLPALTGNGRDRFRPACGCRAVRGGPRPRLFPAAPRNAIVVVASSAQARPAGFQPDRQVPRDVLCVLFRSDATRSVRRAVFRPPHAHAGARARAPRLACCRARRRVTTGRSPTRTRRRGPHDGLGGSCIEAENSKRCVPGVCRAAGRPVRRLRRGSTAEQPSPAIPASSSSAPPLPLPHPSRRSHPRRFPGRVASHHRSLAEQQSPLPSSPLLHACIRPSRLSFAVLTATAAFLPAPPPPPSEVPPQPPIPAGPLPQRQHRATASPAVRLQAPAGLHAASNT